MFGKGGSLFYCWVCELPLPKSQTTFVATAILHTVAIQENNDLAMNEKEYAFDYNENDENNVVPHENNFINNMRWNDIIVNQF